MKNEGRKGISGARATVRLAAALLVATLGLFAILKATQPTAISGGGLLCSVFPGLAP